MALITIKNAAINLDASEIPNLDASKITSGTISNDRLNITQFDDNKIVNDISTLGLRVHTQENLNASNTNSASFDVFQDSSGITNLTNCSRDSAEFISSVVLGTPIKIDYFNPTQSGGGTLPYRVWASNMSGSNNQWTDIVNSDNTKRFDYTTALAVQEGYWKYSPGNYGVNTGYIVDYRENKTFSGQFYVGKTNSWGDVSQFRVQYSTDNSTYTGWDTTNITQSELAYGVGGITSGGTLNSSPKNTDGDFGLADNSTSTYGSSNSKMSGMPEITARYLKLSIMSLHNGKANNNAGISSFQPFLKNLTDNATGSFEGNAISVSSTNKMGAVITYQDNAGTNALNTDIVLKLSADNGSNYTTATLTALPDFATGIKMAKVNDLSVTQGSQLKYKIEFANQASGSKEARIRGVSLQY